MSASAPSLGDAFSNPGSAYDTSSDTTFQTLAVDTGLASTTHDALTYYLGLATLSVTNTMSICFASSVNPFVTSTDVVAYNVRIGSFVVPSGLGAVTAATCSLPTGFSPASIASLVVTFTAPANLYAYTVSGVCNFTGYRVQVQNATQDSRPDVTYSDTPWIPYNLLEPTDSCTTSVSLPNLERGKWFRTKISAACSNLPYRAEEDALCQWIEIPPQRADSPGRPSVTKVMPSASAELDTFDQDSKTLEFRKFIATLVSPIRQKEKRKDFFS
jgi:hypothetical protein